MAFDLNELANSVTKSVSKIGKEASNATKNVTGTMKYNSMISDQKRIINSTYEEIGRLYYQEHCDEDNEAYSEQISRIKAAFEQIAFCERQQMELKGAAVCKNCGAKLKPGAAFCVMCGTKVEVAQEMSAEQEMSATQQATAEQPAAQQTAAEQPAQAQQAATTEQPAQATAEQPVQAQQATAEQPVQAQQATAEQSAAQQTAVPEKPAFQNAPKVCPTCNNAVLQIMIKMKICLLQKEYRNILLNMDVNVLFLRSQYLGMVQRVVTVLKLIC